MSADNGIYILSTTTRYQRVNGTLKRLDKACRVYRVAHAQAIDNFYNYQADELYNLGCYMKQVWGKSPVFFHETKALEYAHNMAKEFEYLEYGVSSINTNYTFFED
jgi:hypothetical protein